MELDELKRGWAEHDQKLDTSIRLNRQLLREVYAGRARSAMARLAAILGLGSVLTLAGVVWLGRFIHDNWAMPRFVWPAVALDAFAIASLATLILQIALAVETDYGQPVAAIQKRLETLRKVRIRYVQAIFATAVLVWVPMFIVAVKAFLGVDVYRVVSTAWLVCNVLLGLALIPLAIWLVRRYGDRMSRSAFGRRFLRDLAGYNLNAAANFMDTLARFEEE